MAHEIYKERFISSGREVPWHRIGLHFSEPILPSEAISLAGFEEPVEVPLELNGQAIPYKAIVMPDSQEVFGVVSDHFRLVRLSDIVDILDQMSEQVPLSATGQLRGGRYIFFTFEQRGTILNEEYIRHIVIIHSYDPKRAWKVLYSPTRVVCMNTLIASEKDAEFTISVKRMGAARDKARGATLYALAQARAKLVDEKLAALAKVGDFDAQLDALFDYIWPLKSAPDVSYLNEEQKMSTLRAYEGYMEYATRGREATLEAYTRFNDEYPHLARTAYAGLQAVVEAADWRVAERKPRDLVRHDVVRVIGRRAQEKVKAWEFVTRLL